MIKHTDISIGAKIRSRRHILGMSQADLASKVGITFQQIQKYEKGQNKIMASRLLELSQIMKTDISYFFEDCINIHQEESGNTALHEEQANFTYDTTDDEEPIGKETIKLVKIYNKIENKDIKRKLLVFLKSLTEPTES